MNPNKFRKLDRELAELWRKRVVTASDLQSFAQRIGRRKATGAQVTGKEPQWVSDEFPNARPISIPFHGKNASIAKGTVKNILNDFEADLLNLKKKYSIKEDEDNDVQEYEGYEN